jgi:hypothetical protein
VKRAEPLEAGARLAQGDGFADELGEIDLGLDLSGSADRQLNDLRNDRRAASPQPPDTAMALSSLDKAQALILTP